MASTQETSAQESPQGAPNVASFSATDDVIDEKQKAVANDALFRAIDDVIDEKDPQAVGASICNFLDDNLKDASKRKIVQIVFYDFPKFVNKPNAKGETPLIYALKEQPTASQTATILQSLIQAKADLEKRDTRGMTPLTWAVYTRNVKAVKMLIEAGVDVNAKVPRPDFGQL